MDFQKIADLCRHARLGYQDGQPGTPEDVQAVLDERDRCIQSYASSVRTLSKKLEDLERNA